MKDQIAIVGLPNRGKTALYYYLTKQLDKSDKIKNRPGNTTESVKYSNYDKTTPIEIIDTPGIMAINNLYKSILEGNGDRSILEKQDREVFYTISDVNTKLYIIVEDSMTKMERDSISKLIESIRKLKKGSAKIIALINRTGAAQDILKNFFKNEEIPFYEFDIYQEKNNWADLLNFLKDNLEEDALKKRIQALKITIWEKALKDKSSLLKVFEQGYIAIKKYMDIIFSETKSVGFAWGLFKSKKNIEDIKNEILKNIDMNLSKNTFMAGVKDAISCRLDINDIKFELNKITEFDTSFLGELRIDPYSKELKDIVKKLISIQLKLINIPTPLFSQKDIVVKLNDIQEVRFDFDKFFNSSEYKAYANLTNSARNNNDRRYRALEEYLNKAIINNLH